MKRCVRIALLLCMMTCHPSCSAVIANYEVLPCNPDAVVDDCNVLNARDGLDATTCELWTCDAAATEHFCVRRSRDVDGDGLFGPYPAGVRCDYTPNDCNDLARVGLDVCDGTDNDCDARIDEDVDAFDPSLSASAPIFPAGSVEHEFAFPASEQTQTWMVGWRQGDSERGRIVDLSAANNDVSTSDASWAFTCGGGAVMNGCVSAYRGVGACDTRACEFDDPTLDTSASTQWAAAVTANAVDCPEGSVQVGQRIDATVRTAHNPTAAGPVGHPSCEAGGARRPTLSALGSEALLAFLAESVRSARACGTGSAEVGVRLLHLDATTPGRVFETGSLSLGATNGDEAPVVRAVANAGWVVAFQDVSGGIAVRWVASGTGQITSLPKLSNGPVGNLRMSVLLRGADAQVGVLFTAGCDRGPLRFASLTLSDLTGPTAARSTDVEVAPSASQAALVTTGVPLVTSNFARNGLSAGSNTSGWLATWSDANGTFARRILALDAEPLGDATRTAAGSAEALFASHATDRALHLYAVDHEGRVTTTPALCAAR